MSSGPAGKEPIVPALSTTTDITPQPDAAPADTPPGEHAPIEHAPVEHAPVEHGGRGGLEPTRYGDWEVGGICSDF
jgi:hypothetical protein